MKEWLSKLAPFLEGFIQLKHSLGYSYCSRIQELHAFDKFVLKNFPNEIVLTKAMVDAWTKPHSAKERHSTTNHRISILRELARFIQMDGTSCYCPGKEYFLRTQQVSCHILNDEEVKKFWRGLAQLKDSEGRQFRKITMTTFFTLLYCTGIRANEAMCLDCSNLDLENGLIKITESKGHNNRIIALTEELVKLLKIYNEQLPTNRIPFFSLDGSCRLNARVVSYTLHYVWNKSDITTPCIKLYDFRHTFITKRLLEWNKQDKDLSTKIQYLMSFVGHKNIEDTLYYFSLSPELSETYELLLNDSIIPSLERDEL